MLGDKLTSRGLGKEPTRSEADPIPTSLAAVQETALAQVRAEAGRIIYNKWSREKQQNAALGLLDAAVSDQMTADITTIRDASNAAEAAIREATASDIDDITDIEKQLILDASDIAWPTI